MVQVLDRTPSLGELLGGGLGQGVASAMLQKSQLQQALALEKQKQSMKQEGVKSLMDSLGFGGNTANQATNETNQPINPQIEQPMQSQENQDISQLEKIATNPQAMLALSTVNPQMANQIQSMYGNLLKQRKFESSQDLAKTKFAFAETKDTRKNIDSAYKSSKETNLIIDKMQSLDKEGLVGKNLALLFDKAGLPISILGNPSSEEFQKLQQQLMKGVMQYGSRILQIEFDNFMKQIPTLLNSKEGRAKIYKNIKLMNQINLDAYDAKKEILSENKGVPPLDLYDRIQNRIEPKMEAVRKEMLNPRSAGGLSEDEIIMTDPSGKRRKVNKKDAVEAQKAGYKIQK
jgi:hypothetical protein